MPSSTKVKGPKSIFIDSTPLTPPPPARGTALIKPLRSSLRVRYHELFEIFDSVIHFNFFYDIRLLYLKKGSVPPMEAFSAIRNWVANEKV